MVVHAFNPALGTQRQVDLCEFKASVMYKASSRTVRATHRNPVSGKTNKNKRERKKKKKRMGILEAGEIAQLLFQRAQVLEPHDGSTLQFQEI